MTPASAFAHGFRPGVLALTEDAPEQFTVVWTPPVDTNRLAQVEVTFPEPCVHADDRLRCGPAGLHGTIAFPGLSEQRASVTVVIDRLDGSSVETMVRPAEASMAVDDARRRSAWSWVQLGAAHIFAGLDHIGFVLGLMLVVGVGNLRRLLATVTAFTVAHSLTLALAATGALTLPAAPVEATIAASVLLVAREGTGSAPTLTRRAPWAVASIFGLVHGLGFAGALRSAGLPPAHFDFGLLCFNVGVELGQLAIVLPAYALARALPSLSPMRRPACYVLGGLAAWWLLERTIAIVTAAS